MSPSAAKKHSMITCYDATFARLISAAGTMDSLLVGDSVGMVVGGATSTVEVTLEQMLYHTRAVARGRAQAQKDDSKIRLPLLIADLPAGTYDEPIQALKSSQALLAAGADAVKLEGPMTAVVAALRLNKIRVVGHIGLTPQSILEFKVQGKSASEAERLLKEARDLEKAGVEMLVLEMVPRELAAQITAELAITTIGIGAGPDCGGQVLVLYDMLGLNRGFHPKFLRTFADGANSVEAAVKNYSAEVAAQTFPSDAESFHGIRP